MCACMYVHMYVCVCACVYSMYVCIVVVPSTDNNLSTMDDLHVVELLIDVLERHMEV